MYDELDRLILKRVSLAAMGIGFTEMVCGIVGQECARIANLQVRNGRPRNSGRVLDGRLQRLRKQGKIKHDSKWGWMLVKPEAAE